MTGGRDCPRIPHIAMAESNNWNTELSLNSGCVTGPRFSGGDRPGGYRPERRDLPWGWSRRGRRQAVPGCWRPKRLRTNLREFPWRPMCPARPSSGLTAVADSRYSGPLGHLGQPPLKRGPAKRQRHRRQAEFSEALGRRLWCRIPACTPGGKILGAQRALLYLTVLASSATAEAVWPSILSRYQAASDTSSRLWEGPWARICVKWSFAPGSPNRPSISAASLANSW